MIIHLAELSKRLKTRASQMLIYLWVFFLPRYICTLLQRARINNVKILFFIILNLKMLKLFLKL